MQLIHGDCLEKMKDIPDNSVDSIVTDPPYGLSFMGKKWDYDVPSVDIWKECLRVLKPGGHLLAFAGTRTQHRMAVRIEDSGFEIRDMIAWVYGSGFPKSLDVSKAIDKAAGAVGGRGEMKRGGERLLNQTQDGSRDGGGTWGDEVGRSAYTYVPATDAARQWQGFGTSLKPALEPITVARKPLIGTVANNVLTYGTGALNIDGSRVGTDTITTIGSAKKSTSAYGDYVGMKPTEHEGRWPANLIHDGSEEATELFPGQDDKSASRFFYCAKANKKDRNEGLPEGEKSNHPTVKPTKLMRYLCKLVTRPGGIVLDPFMGSGSTGKASKLEGFDFIGIEKDENYFKIAQNRILGI